MLEFFLNCRSEWIYIEKNISGSKNSSNGKSYSFVWEKFCSENICFLQRDADVDNLCVQQVANPPKELADYPPVGFCVQQWKHEQSTRL